MVSKGAEVRASLAIATFPHEVGIAPAAGLGVLFLCGRGSVERLEDVVVRASD